jgi:hypothetical protein
MKQTGRPAEAERKRRTLPRGDLTIPAQGPDLPGEGAVVSAAEREINALMALHPKGFDLSLGRITNGCSSGWAIRMRSCRR